MIWLVRATRPCFIILYPLTFFYLFTIHAYTVLRSVYWFVIKINKRQCNVIYFFMLCYIFLPVLMNLLHRDMKSSLHMKQSEALIWQNQVTSSFKNFGLSQISVANASLCS